MRLLLPLTLLALLFTAGSVHPQPFYEPFDRGPPPPPEEGEPPPPPPPPARRMVCYVEPPAPFPARACPTHQGYPGSPCRCAGTFIEGIRDFAE